MCNFIRNEKEEPVMHYEQEYDHDTCPGCGMHFSMCECRRTNDNKKIDICGPDYPPC